MTRARPRGQAIVESALTIVLVTSMLLGLFDVACGWWTWQTLDAAANEGTRWAIVHGSDSGTTMTQATTALTPYLQNNFGTGLPSNTVFTISWPDGSNDPGDRVDVTLSAQFQPTTTFITHSAITLQAVSEMIIIR